MARTSDRPTLPLVLQALRPLVERLSPQQAGPAAHTLLDAMKSTSSGDILSFSAQALGLLAARLPPDEARRVAAAAARKLLDSVLLDPQPMIQNCAVAVEALAPHLVPEEAAAAAQKLLDALARNTDRGISGVAQALAALAARLPQEEASRLAATAVPMFLDGPHPNLFLIGDYLPGLAARLQPGDAHRVSAAAVPKLLDMVARDPQVDSGLAKSLGSLAAGLTAEEAGKVLRAVQQKLLDSLFTAEAPGNLAALAGALASLAARLTPAETSRLSALAAQKLLDAMARANIRGMVLPGGYAEGSSELTALAANLDTDGLIELLKRPTCVAHARRALLRELSRRLGPPAPEAGAIVAHAVAAPPPSALTAAALLVYGESLYPGGRRPFADQWEAVDWLSQHHPEHDLSRPLRPLASPAPVANK
jgi:hypothetical protein